MEQHQYSVGPFGAFPAYAAPQMGYAMPPQLEMMQPAAPLHLGHLGPGVGPPQAAPPQKPQKPVKKKPVKKGLTKKEIEKKRREKERARREKEKAKLKGGRKKKARDPNAPKRARTAFNFFLDDFRNEYKKKHPESKGVVEVTKSGSLKWKTMTDLDKEPYETKAREAQELYIKEKAVYEANDGPKKFRIAGATKPKRPPTAYFMFLSFYRNEWRQQHPGVKGIKDMSKAAGEQWRSMAPEGKKLCLQRALAAKAEYMRIKELPREERQVYIEDDNLYKRFQEGNF